MNKNCKTLDDYIRLGRHEFVAYIRHPLYRISLDLSLDYDILGNDIGKIFVGVLVCEKSRKNKWLKFLHRSNPVFKGDSDIYSVEFDFSAEIISEEPLSISTRFSNHHNLIKDTKEFKSAKKLLEKYGFF